MRNRFQFQLIPFYFIIFIALFGGLFFTLGVPKNLSIISEFSIYILFLISLISRNKKQLFIPHLTFFFVSFVAICILSIILNESRPARAIFSFRLLFRFYFFYLAIILLEPDDGLIKKMNDFIGFLLVAQIPVVAIKFIKYGISEKTMGAYAIHDGSIATTLPISFIFYLASFYYLYKKNIHYIIIIILFVIFSIVASKRAVFFLYPFQFMFLYFFIYLKKAKISIFKKVSTFSALTIIIMVVSGTILHFNSTLNPDEKIGGSIDIGYAVDYAKKYNVGVDGYGYSYGRIATTKRAFKHLFESGIGNILIGFGPGVATEASSLESKKYRELQQEKYDNFKIGYGVTTIVRIALEYGLIGVFYFSFMLFFFSSLCWRLYKIESTPYFRAFAAGSLGFSLSMIFFAFAYHDSAFWGDTMPALYFYAMAIVSTRYKRQYKHNQISEMHNIQYRSL